MLAAPFDVVSYVSYTAPGVMVWLVPLFVRHDIHPGRAPDVSWRDKGDDCFAV